MADIEELEQRVKDLEQRLLYVERSIFSERYGKVESTARTTAGPSAE